METITTRIWYFVPRRNFSRLLLIPRMGSFNSAPKINNTDSQDDNTAVPNGLSQNDFIRHCQIMRGECQPQLIYRKFMKPITSAGILSDISDDMRILKLDSVSTYCSSPDSSPNHLRILQWNILSQTLGQNNDGFVCCPEEALTWEVRKYQILQEIVQNEPDVVCLQEVDHFKFFQYMLNTQNYEGIFFPKPDSPCLYIKENNGPDGCAIFYKRTKFDVVNFATRVLEVWRVQSNQVVIALNLRVRETGKEFTVGTTHLKARNGALLSKLRNEQGKDLLQFVTKVANGRPVILNGDFNAEPTEPVYRTILGHQVLGLSSAYADMCIADKMKVFEKNDEVNHNLNELHEKYDDDSNEEETTTQAEFAASKEPLYTTWKIREDGEVCHTIDYMFYTKNKFKVKNCLMLPDGSELGKDRAPSFKYPSDHFSLVCDFEFEN